MFHMQLWSLQSINRIIPIYKIVKLNERLTNLIYHKSKRFIINNTEYGMSNIINAMHGIQNHLTFLFKVHKNT